MTIKEFEGKLKEIDPKFEIVPHPRSEDLAGVYYDRNIANKTGFVVTVPSQEIRDEFDASFQDTIGHPHNWASKVIAVAKDHISKLESDPAYKEAFYAPIEEMTNQARRQ